MRRQPLWVTLLSLTLFLTSGCGTVPALHGSSDTPSALAAESRALSLKRPPWSRRLQQTKDGYYYQPAGLCDDYAPDQRTEAKIRHDLSTLQQVGAKQLRFAFAWDDIETSPGKYDWTFWDKLVDLAPQYGVTLIPYVCYTPQWLGSDPDNFWHQAPKDLSAFGRFMNVIASRYKGKIHTWELWNEPDNQQYWLGTVDQFAKMEIEAAAQVRKADPDAALVLGGMAGGRGAFFDTLMTKYQLGRYFDVINFHGYLETWNNDRAETYPDHVTAMQELLDQTAPNVDLWMAEFGYSNYRFSPNEVSQWGVDAVYGYEHTSDFQAVALFRGHVLALSTGRLALTAWYRINDLPPSTGVIGDDNNKFLGVLDVEGNPKPAYYALKLYNHLFDQPVRLADSAVHVTKPANSQSVIHVFQKKNGDYVIVAWLRSSLRQEVTDKSGNATDSRHEVLSVELPHMGLTHLRVFDVHDAAPFQHASISNDTVSNIGLEGDRVFVGLVSS